MRKLSISRSWGRPGTSPCAALVLLAGALIALACPAITRAAADAAQPTTPPRDPLASLVAGLLAYTSWPTPVNPVRLCIWGHERDVAGMQAAALSSSQRKVTVQHDIGVAQAAQRCDALYVALSASAAARNLAHALVGRPVLVIGEGLSYCAEGGMVCVATAERPLKFQANLDAIARSGLRMDPQALRIGRPAAGAAP